MRILNEWAGGDLYPDDKRAEIDELNGWIYSELQNGVYRAGFARSRRPTRPPTAACSSRCRASRRCSRTAAT